MTAPLMIDTAAVSRLTGIKPETLRAWRRTGRGPKAVKVGRRWVYRPDEVRRWVDAQFDTAAHPRDVALVDLAREWLADHPAGPRMIPADVIVAADPGLHATRRLIASETWRYTEQPHGPGFVFPEHSDGFVFAASA